MSRDNLDKQYFGRSYMGMVVISILCRVCGNLRTYKTGRIDYHIHKCARCGTQNTAMGVHVTESVEVLD